MCRTECNVVENVLVQNEKDERKWQQLCIPKAMKITDLVDALVQSNPSNQINMRKLLKCNLFDDKFNKMLRSKYYVADGDRLCMLCYAHCTENYSTFILRMLCHAIAKRN